MNIVFIGNYIFNLGLILLNIIILIKSWENTFYFGLSVSFSLMIWGALFVIVGEEGIKNENRKRL